jgi:hypothetical protein
LRHSLIVTYGDIETMEIAHVSDTALMTAAARAELLCFGIGVRRYSNSGRVFSYRFSNSASLLSRKGLPGGLLLC